jgi:hypothetical protein
MGLTSSLDATRRRVIVPHVEIGGSVAEKDVMERVAIELGWSDFSLRYVSYRVRPMLLCHNEWISTSDQKRGGTPGE